MAGSTANDQDLINRLTEIVLSKLSDEHFGVNELASEAGMSHYLLSKKLNEKTGKTVISFISEVRLKKAHEMLQNENVTVAEVAYKTGFGSATYFTSTFTKFYGYPPGKVRRGGTNDPVFTEVKDNAEGKPVYTRKKRNLLIASLVIILAVVIGFQIIKNYNSKDISRNSSFKSEKSVAVLPFRNLSDSTGNKYFADGITEDIRMLLSKLGDLRIVSGTSVEQLRESNLSARELAARLKVNYLIDGSVQKSGNSFRLWIQLIDARKGYQLWAESYEDDYTTDLFAFQSRIARRVASSLDAFISADEDNKINRVPTNDILAHTLFMKGDAEMRKLSLEGYYPNTRIPFYFFDQALKIDSNYIDALLGKALWYSRFGKPDSTLLLCRKILTLDSENAGAMNKIAGVLLYGDKPDSALYYFDQAIKYNDDEEYPWDYMGAGQALFMGLNKPIEALQFYQTAYEIGGDSWAGINENVSSLFFYLGDYDRALKYMLHALSLESGCRHLMRIFPILLAQEKYDEALSFLDSVGRINPCQMQNDILRMQLYIEKKEFHKADTLLNKAISSGYFPGFDDACYTAYLYKKTGRESEAKSILYQYINMHEGRIRNKRAFWMSTTILRLAASYAILGDRNKTIEYLSKLEDAGYVEHPLSIRTFPGFDDLRDDPDFIAILDRLEKKRDDLRVRIEKLREKGEFNI